MTAPPTDDLEPDFAALAAEARRLEPRVLRTSTRTSEGFKTVLVIDTAGLTTAEVSALSDGLKAFRRSRDLAAEFGVEPAVIRKVLNRLLYGDVR